MHANGTLLGDHAAGAPLAPRLPGRRSRARRAALALAAAALAAFAAVGSFGAFRYVWTFLLYRGEPPPSVPSRVALPGARHRVVSVVPAQVVHISVRSPALGGRAVPVVVVLPPGYASHPAQRYPTFYLLEGYPAFGGPQSFVNVGNIAGLESVLVAEGRMSPTILVMPSGSPSLLVDTEWANGVRRDNGWETFVARDLVRAIQARYRALRSGASRAIGGLSEGGYGALNIAIHHPGEFRVVESWSGYMLADDIPAVFGRNPARRRLNSPAIQVVAAAARLRAARTYIWFYCGTADYDVAQNRSFAALLTRLGIAHRFRIVPGNHNWGLWRSQLPAALLAASSHLAHG
ncbi:MAG TPA: alpha/beta hydrolase-fold protein [Acidimicrobiales bacterium]|nr:alpha/beta hydrolase-fold protein [Acidimicrobiales bacterium]